MHLDAKDPRNYVFKPMRHLQTASVFALKHGITEGAAREATKELLLKSIRKHGDCLQTGFRGTGFLMDALTECGAVDTAYTLLLQHKNPSWLYSVAASRRGYVRQKER
jgi:alpha-L-rhamnosidase